MPRTLARETFSGPKLRAIREEAEWSREDLSIASGYSSQQISHFERAAVPLPKRAALAFAYVLDIDVDDLLEESRPARRGRR